MSYRVIGQPLETNSSLLLSIHSRFFRIFSCGVYTLFVNIYLSWTPGLWLVKSQGHSVLGRCFGEHFSYTISSIRPSPLKLYIYSFPYYFYMSTMFEIQEQPPIHLKMRPIPHDLLPPSPPSRATNSFEFGTRQALPALYICIW